jgi:hypothetical protein
MSDGTQSVFTQNLLYRHGMLRHLAECETMNLMDEYPTLREWCTLHPDLASHIRFTTISTDGVLSRMSFSLKRTSAHANAVNELLLHAQEIKRNLIRTSEALARLLEPSRFEIDFSYDDIHSIYTVRQYIFVLKKIQAHRISFFTVRYASLEFREAVVKCLLDFFQGNTIPPGVVCAIDPRFMTFEYPTSVRTYERLLHYLQPLALTLQERVGLLQKAGWVNGFQPFFIELVKKCRADHDAGYVQPSDGEESLARYLFNAHSPVRKTIDLKLKSFADQPAAAFSSHLVAFCSELMPAGANLTTGEQSVALVILFRVLFNRCYELLPQVIRPTVDVHFNVKVRDIGAIPAGDFPLPWLYMPRNCDHNTPLGEIARVDPFFAAAAQFLFPTAFDTNPLDCLWRVHRCLLQIHKSSLIHSADGKELTVVETTKLMALDDLFSVFLMVFIGAQTPDVMPMVRLIRDFAPREGLSPSFQYAQSNVEALLIHVDSLDVNALREASSKARRDFPTTERLQSG